MFINIHERTDNEIRGALRDCAPDLDVLYAFWPGQRRGTTQCFYHFGTYLHHPGLPLATFRDEAGESSWPPGPDDVRAVTEEAVTRLRKMWVARLLAAGQRPAAGWELDLAREIGLGTEEKT